MRVGKNTYSFILPTLIRFLFKPKSCVCVCLLTYYVTWESFMLHVLFASVYFLFCTQDFLVGVIVVVVVLFIVSKQKSLFTISTSKINEKQILPIHRKWAKYGKNLSWCLFCGCMWVLRTFCVWFFSGAVSVYLQRSHRRHSTPDTTIVRTTILRWFVLFHWLKIFLIFSCYVRVLDNKPKFNLH